MKKELPNYVFERAHEKFYLLTEFDVIFNKRFTDSLVAFMSKKSNKDIYINLELHDEYELYVPKEIVLSSAEELNNFYEMKTNLDSNEVFYYMFNFFISDCTKSWEIYVSLENELSIIGCSNELNSLFEIIFNPYEEESLDKKYKIIGDKFCDDGERKFFFNSLDRNYNFNNNV